MSQDVISRAVNSIRTLTIDAIEQAGSGHPGMPLGAAPMGYVLYQRIMNHNPKNPGWWNRDRYIQSAGHGSMLHYSLLHLCGYELSMDELRNTRQWGSKTPGHPEVHHTPGVEMTTGPLGQGLASAVGFALAEAHLAAVYNRDGFEVFNHFTYVIASDGDIMEGVTAEAASLAGHLGLSKLIVLYDDNDVTLDTKLEVSMSESVLTRYEAYGWHVQLVRDGNSLTAIEAAIKTAKHDPRPSIIAVKTIIGYGAPGKQGSSAAHGSALGATEAKAAKEYLGVDWPAFSVPKDVREHYKEAATRGQEAEKAWQKMYKSYQKAHPELAIQLGRIMAGELPKIPGRSLPKFAPGGKTATRNASHKVLNALAAYTPELMGGSADLAGSTKTDIKDTGILQKGEYAERNIYFGVREHAMAAIANGMALHGGIRPYAGTFLIFSDYLRPSLRLGALMETPVIYVFTHDSIGLGGDGPTHQPIASLTALRAIPNVTVIRPADANETVQAWLAALSNTSGPTALIFSRQDLPHLNVPSRSVAKGGYILADCEGTPDIILIGTGSEVYKCLEAKTRLDKAGISTRVVSMPSLELFEKQSKRYQDSVLPPEVRKRLVVEAGATLGWYKLAGLDGAVIGIDHFGASAEGDELMERYGISTSNIVRQAKKLQG